VEGNNFGLISRHLTGQTEKNDEPCPLSKEGR
jgi:hypothetical protein